MVGKGRYSVCCPSPSQAKRTSITSFFIKKKKNLSHQWLSTINMISKQHLISALYCILCQLITQLLVLSNTLVIHLQHKHRSCLRRKFNIGKMDLCFVWIMTMCGDNMICVDVALLVCKLTTEYKIISPTFHLDDI